MEEKRKPGRKRIDPRFKKTGLHVNVPQWIADVVRDQDQPAGTVVELAIMRAFRLRRPKRCDPVEDR